MKTSIKAALQGVAIGVTIVAVIAAIFFGGLHVYESTPREVERHGVATFMRSADCKALSQKFEESVNAEDLLASTKDMQKLAAYRCDPGYLLGKNYPLETASWLSREGVRDKCVKTRLKLAFGKSISLSPEGKAFLHAKFDWLGCQYYNQ